MALTNEFFKFFKDLAKNNNREWFHANKKQYENAVKEPFKELVGEVILQLQKTHPEIQIEPKDAIFRINRDIRFSKDKTPYKTNVSAIISSGGRKNKTKPGYYIHVDAGMLMPISWKKMTCFECGNTLCSILKSLQRWQGIKNLSLILNI